MVNTKRPAAAMGSSTTAAGSSTDTKGKSVVASGSSTDVKGKASGSSTAAAGSSTDIKGKSVVASGSSTDVERKASGSSSVVDDESTTTLLPSPDDGLCSIAGYLYAYHAKQRANQSQHDISVVGSESSTAVVATGSSTDTKGKSTARSWLYQMHDSGRRLLLEHILVRAEPIRLQPRGNEERVVMVRNHGETPPPIIPLFLCCKALHEEARDILYGSNIFAIHHSARKKQGHMMMWFLNQIPAEDVFRLERIRMHLPKLHRHAFPLLNRDLAHPRLKREDALCVRQVMERVAFLRTLDLEAHHTLDGLESIYRHWLSGNRSEFGKLRRVFRLVAAELHSGLIRIDRGRVSIIVDIENRDMGVVTELESLAQDPTIGWRTERVDNRPT
ncbi:hypothetical protein QBC34DRAFT_148278 [Podospora aff. communis PSN243]|uniref:Uncharacterized protein n=1 Tax=Podospora aff. communis PSN243 TaxID=3040156 RepID=A0AAV9GHJ0_9PEZI|nr:hypothetical protein QBC34DRAFT_148278 [Podospora aff. communis PSN243]